jgi:hypothetical protein
MARQSALTAHGIHTNLVRFIRGRLLVLFSRLEVPVPASSVLEPGPFLLRGNLVALRSTVPFAIPLIPRFLTLGVRGDVLTQYIASTLLVLGQ